MKKTALALLLIVTLFALTSCEIISWFWNGTMDRVLLSGQKSLYMSSNSTSRAAGDGWLSGVISTIDEQNSVSELVFADGNKTYTQKKFELTPIAVTDYGNGFFTIRFEPYPAIYLVEKSTGKALCLNMVGNNVQNYSMGVWNIWYDGNDSIYLRTAHLFGEKWQWLEVRKGSLTTGKVTAISPSQKTACNYGVDSTGLVLCLLGPNGENVFHYSYCGFTEIVEIYPDGSMKYYDLSGNYSGSTMFADSNDTFWLSTQTVMAKFVKENDSYSIEEYMNPGGQIVNPRFFGNKIYYRSNGFVSGTPDLGEPIYIESKVGCEIHWFDCDTGTDHVLDLGSFLATQIE